MRAGASRAAPKPVAARVARPPWPVHPASAVRWQAKPARAAALRAEHLVRPAMVQATAGQEAERAALLRVARLAKPAEGALDLRRVRRLKPGVAEARTMTARARSRATS